MLKSPDQALRIPLRIFNLVPEEKRRLGLIVFFIAAIHLALFFFLEIHYPATQPTSSRRSEIFLSTAHLMSGDSWHRTQFWNQMRDPSTLLHQSLIPTEKKIALRPLFENSSSSTLPLLAIGSEAESPWEEAVPLENRAMEKMISTPRNFTYSTTLSNVSHSTRIYFSKNLDARKKTISTSPPKLTVNLLNESGTTTIRLGVNAEGIVLHALIEESSGAANVDQIALQECRKMIFQPISNGDVEWGNVTFFWAFDNTPPAKETP
ncbi:MAG: energy transducer TonB [Verrucomicrobiota bacterium]